MRWLALFILVAASAATAAVTFAAQQPVAPAQAQPQAQAPNQPQALPNPYPTGSFYPFGIPKAAPLFQYSNVRKELNLTDPQFNQLNQSFGQLNTRFAEEFALFQNLDPEQRAVKLQELRRNFNEQFLKSAGGLLNEQQVNRLRQLELQNFGLSVFAEPNFPTQFNLTVQQRERIAALQNQANKSLQEITTLSSTNLDDALRRYQAWRQATQTELNNILTEQQRRMWAQMTGSPFVFTPPFSTPPM
jgi:hypothetical protein